MGLLAPVWLLLLLLGGLIVWLHLQRRARRTQEVSSTYLWRKLAQDLPPDTPRQPPPLDYLMFLQLGLLAMLALALSQPVLGLLQPPQHLIYVLDASGSMQASDVLPGRFEQAKSQLQSFIQTHRDGPKNLVSLVVAGPSPEVIAARQTQSVGILEEVKRIQATQGSPRWDRVASLVRALHLEGEKTKIILLSDGDLDARRALSGLNLPLEERVLAAKGVNLGFTSVRVTPPEKGFRRTKVNGEIRQFGSEQAAVTVEVYFRTEDASEPVLLTSQKVSLARNRAASFEVFFSLPGSGLLELRLPKDTLEQDNHAFFVLRKEPKTLRVLHLGLPNPLLERVLRAIPGIELFDVKALPDDHPLYDLVVVDRVALDTPPRTNTLWIDSQPHSSKANLPDPYPSGWLEAHPLSSGVNWADLEIRSAQDFSRQPGAEILLEASGHPLIQASTTQYGRQVTVAFDPEQSNWPRQPSFPVFIYNLVRWIEPSVGSNLMPSCEVGFTCALDPRFLAGEWQLFDPDNQPLVLKSAFIQEGQDRWLPRSLEGLFQPQRSGVYTLVAGSLRQSIAVNAFGAESDIRAKSEGMAVSRLSLPPRPLWIWLLVAALVGLALELVLAARLEGIRLSSLRGNTPLALRRRRSLWLQGLAGLALLLALLPLKLPFPSNRFTTVVVSDRPELHSGRSSETIQKAQEQGHSLVWLGSEPTLASRKNPTPQNNDQGADLEAALSVATALVPTADRGRIVLISDGYQTRGQAVAAIPQLIGRKIPVDVLPIGGIPAGEVFVDNLFLPSQIHAGDWVVLHGILYSDKNTTATVRILRQGQPWVERSLVLLNGRNRLEIPIHESQPGTYRFDLEVKTVQDTFEQNNRRAVSLEVKPQPKVALFALEAAPAQVLAESLKIQGITAEIKPPSDAPKNLEGWASYEAAILMNLPATRLSTEQQKALEAWVKDQGGGLLMLGGANSFGPGGYYRTALDRLSPLSSKIPQEAPKVAMLFLLDKSGSMNQPTGDANTRRVDIARQAILEAIRLLHPESLAGVIAFDTQAEVVVPVQSIKNQTAFEEALSRIQTGGGTALYPALVAAYGQMHGVDSLSRHVVLLSDGLSEQGQFEDIVGRLAQENITLSTVAIGEGADVDLVEKLARLGRGAAHVSTDWQALPGILAQEALLLSATPVKEKPFIPQWTAVDHLTLTGWPTALPALGGYVLTTPKPNALLHLVGPNAAPLLASWRVGLGQVFAFTSQGVGRWASPWTQLPQFPQMWGQVVHQILKPTVNPGLNLRTRYVGDELELEVEAIQPDATPQTGLLLEASLSAEKEQHFPLHEQSPGLYTASVIPQKAVSYSLKVSSKGEPATEVNRQVLPPETVRYAFGGGSDLMLGLSQATGGKVLLGADNLGSSPKPIHWETRPAWPLFALLSLGLFLAGLWVRYRPAAKPVRVRKPSLA